MITKEQNTALLAVGNAALANEDWADYADYCFSREKGLRKQAFTYLNKFLKLVVSGLESIHLIHY